MYVYVSVSETWVLPPETCTDNYIIKLSILKVYVYVHLGVELITPSALNAVLGQFDFSMRGVSYRI